MTTSGNSTTNDGGVSTTLRSAKDESNGVSTTHIGISNHNHKLTPSLLQKKSEPLQNRLLASLNKVADVHLVGDDGVHVPALRCVLSCTSPVFEVMLYGKFAESKKAVIPIDGVNSTVLRKMVDFCCSDQLLVSAPASSILEEEERKGKGSDHSLREVSESILLAEIGDKYQIPGLEEAVVDSLRQWIQKDPSLACVIFDLSNPDLTPLVRSLSWQIILERPHETLQPHAMHSHGGIQCLSPTKLQELFQGVRQIRAKPLYMFQRLLEWYKSRLTIDDEDIKDLATKICREATGNIHLAAIDPHDLKEVVHRAPFVDKDDIMQAFMEQATLAQKFGLDFSVSYKHGEQPQCRHVMVEGAGVEQINGIYVQDETPAITALIQQQFTKKSPIPGEQVFLVQGRDDGLWFICDPTKYYYHCKSPDVLPSTGWIMVAEHGVAPAPTCKFFFYNDLVEDEEH